jgi:hypothetical protein
MKPSVEYRNGELIWDKDFKNEEQLKIEESKRAGYNEGVKHGYAKGVDCYDKSRRPTEYFY